MCEMHAEFMTKKNSQPYRREFFPEMLFIARASASLELSNFEGKIAKYSYHFKVLECIVERNTMYNQTGLTICDIKICDMKLTFIHN